ncbi:MAG: hypothetical protein ACSLFA_16005 [Mycobacterium sp.]
MPTVAGRAFVVPASTGNIGSGEDGNVNNFRANSRARSSTLLVAVSAADGAPVDPSAKRITARLPNWLRMVMYYAGNNDGPWQELPAVLHVPVWIDVSTRQIEALDVDDAATELAGYRGVGRKEWLHTEAPLSDVRAVLGLPSMALRAARGVIPAVQDLVNDIRGIGDAVPAHREISPAELETRRRTAAMLRFQLERDPKQCRKVRESALQAGPSIAQSTRAGRYPPAEFDAWVMFQHTSGVITDEEAQQFRHEAGRG